MSIELVNALGVWFTAIVIAATAVAALVQLRHIRASNELSAFSEAWDMWHTEPVQRGWAFIEHELSKKMEDPNFRCALDTAGVVDHIAHPEVVVCDWIDNIGVMVMLGMLREDVILLPAAQAISTAWDRLAPTIAIMRRKRGPQLYAAFEYLNNRSRVWQQRYPNGFEVIGWQRVPVADPWLEADKASAAQTGA